MRVIVTRPEPQASQWVALLQPHGVHALALPLLRIEPVVPGRAERQRLRQALSACQMVMFVSPNAVRHFFADAMPGLQWPTGCVAAATGPGTVAALREAGVPDACVAAPARDAPQFDSRTLWTELRGNDWQGARVLIVRGEGGGRDWLADTLRKAGAEVEFVPAYRRAPPAWEAGARSLLDQALATPNAHAWFFSSSQAIGHLVEHLRQAPAPVPWERMRALTTHPRIEQAALQVGFGQVQVMLPSVEALVAQVRALVIAPG